MIDKHKAMLAQAAEATGVAQGLQREAGGGSTGGNGDADLGRVLEVLESSSLDWLLDDREQSKELLAELEVRLAGAVRDSGKNGAV